MGCNSDHMNPNSLEIEISKVAAFLDELETGDLNRNHLGGYHPDVYGKGPSKDMADEYVRHLCGELKRRKVTRYSLEMQMGWRDHQAADREREAKETKAVSKAALRRAAMAKLTPEERKALGL